MPHESQGQMKGKIKVWCMYKSMNIEEVSYQYKDTQLLKNVYMNE